MVWHLRNLGFNLETTGAVCEELQPGNGSHQITFLRVNSNFLFPGVPRTLTLLVITLCSYTGIQASDDPWVTDYGETGNESDHC